MERINQQSRRLILMKRKNNRKNSREQLNLMRIIKKLKRMRNQKREKLKENIPKPMNTRKPHHPEKPVPCLLVICLGIQMRTLWPNAFNLVEKSSIQELYPITKERVEVLVTLILLQKKL